MIPTIANECSDFISESNGKYLVKNLPKTYQGFSKVKVRLKKHTTDFIENFNAAFETRRRDLHQRSIFAYTDTHILTESIDKEPFFIFPINGYKIIFNPLVQNSKNDFKPYTQLDIDGDIVADQLKISYNAGTLDEALSANCEVVIYNIPYYYAIRTSLVHDYALFFGNNE